MEDFKILFHSFSIYDYLAICPWASAETGETSSFSLSPAAADRNYHSSSQWLRFVQYTWRVVLSAVFLYHLLTLSQRDVHIDAACMGWCRVLTWNIVLQPLSRIAGPIKAAPGWQSKQCLRASQEAKDHQGGSYHRYPYSTAQARARAKGLSPSTAIMGEGDSWRLISDLIQSHCHCSSRNGPDLLAQTQKGKGK